MLIPFATDARFDDDSLFIVFVEDFRFAPCVDDPAWKHDGRVDKSRSIAASLFGSSPPPTTGSSGSTDAASSSQLPDGGNTRSHPNLWLRGPKAAESNVTLQARSGGGDGQRVSAFLRDLVAYSVVAQRMGHGEFMFLGWQPHGAGEKSPAINRFRSGLMLSMFSKDGALRLKNGFEMDASLKIPGHIDLKLRNFWSKIHNCEVSYITPPIGGYTEHVSGCERQYFLKPRPSIWMEKFCCPGTRNSHDWEHPAREKWICTFTEKGGCKFLKAVDIEVPDESVTWRTFDAREDAGVAEPTAGWGRWKWNYEADCWEQETARKFRVGRSLRMKEKFRVWVDEKGAAFIVEKHGCLFSCLA